MYVKKHYTKCLTNLQSYKSKNYRLALEESFMKIDEQMQTDSAKKELTDESGCTATVALVTPSEIFCCNAGDSRTVLSKAKIAIDLSVDHKPNLPDEQRRIYAANSYVEEQRVNGMLALSRALGDFDYKKNANLSARDQAVTAFPEIKSMQITPGDTEFLLLACDGIWDVMSSQVAVNYIHKECYGDQFQMEAKKRTHKELTQGMTNMFDECCAKDVVSSQGLGCDNMTAILVEFKSTPK